MTELLLVGPGHHTLDFQRMVRTCEPDWEVLQCPDADTALGRVKRRPADIVLACFDKVADHETLFAMISGPNPGAIRLALFQSAPGKVQGAHQCVSSRGDPHDLHPVLQAASEVAARTAPHEGLRNIVSRFQDVPSPPLLYFEIREQLESAAGTAASMAQIASRDPALVARTLKTANSGFFARPRSVSDLTEAIQLLGADSLLGIVLAAHLYSGLPPPGLRLDSLWQHSNEVAGLARQICRIEGGNRDSVSQAYIAGLLHDIGLMVLLQNESARYQPLWKQCGGDESVLTQLEQATFGVTHGELGAVILKLWNLPAAVVSAVANSHAPDVAGTALALPDRAVLAAEWLLEQTAPVPADTLPSALADTTNQSLELWQQARDQIKAAAS